LRDENTCGFPRRGIHWIPAAYAIFSFTNPEEGETGTGIAQYQRGFYADIGATLMLRKFTKKKLDSVNPFW
jgi:hypothetical protein